MPRLRSSRADERPSLGGAIIILLLLGLLGYAIVGRVVDGLMLVYDADARPTERMHGNLATIVGVGFYVLAVLVSVLAAAQSEGGRRADAFVLCIQGLVVWWCSMSIVVPRAPGVARFLTLGAIPLVFGLVSSPPSRASLRQLTLLIDVFAVLNIAYSLAYPSLAQVPCRVDKCGIFGAMYSGFFLQENVAPNLVAFFLPAAITARSDRRCSISLVLAAATALTSGSRTGLMSVAVSIGCVVVARRRLRQAQGPLTIPKTILSIPLLAAVASLLILLYAQPDSLTGRGVVYEAIRNAMNGPALIYGTDWDLVPRMTDGYLAGEHGQIPHVLARAGIVGAVLLFVSLFYLRGRVVANERHTIGLSVLIAASAGMLTEPRFELDARTVGFTALLLMVGLMAAPLEGLVWSSSPATTGWKKPSWIALAVGAIIAFVVPLVVPPMYRASTQVFVSSASRNPIGSGQALTTSEIKTTGYTVLANSDATLERVAWRLGISSTPDGLREAFGVRRDQRETVIRLQVDNTDPTVAAALVDTWAAQLQSDAEQLEFRSHDAPAQATLTAAGQSLVKDIRWSTYWPLTAGLLAATLGLASSLARRSRRHLYQSTPEGT